MEHAEAQALQPEMEQQCPAPAAAPTAEVQEVQGSFTGPDMPHKRHATATCSTSGPLPSASDSELVGQPVLTWPWLQHACAVHLLVAVHPCRYVCKNLR